ncbi:hypothetical protein [Actinokineospora diospyrosa]|uniref:Phospholipase D-like protein n=1 Tax=Actinokineospora diospyrosa TaxID=103728 RepID=A0ABT1I8E1_9PSEU|nr:hypothetical protein [Actinokineospora diospyrosa]MCP2268904.1 hypothetical protein [Actinokineospora diospyrosa]
MTTQDAVSPQGLAVRARHRRNPYTYMLDDTRFAEVLLAAGLRRAESIALGHGTDGPRGRYPRPCMAFVILDPTAHAWEPDHEAVLAALTIGDGALPFLPNAAAKASGHRRTHRNHGEAALVDHHLLGTGNFRYGHSANVRGLIIGASSQTADQDLYEAAALATDLVEALLTHHRTWEHQVGAGRWIGDPDPRFQAMVDFFTD